MQAILLAAGESSRMYPFSNGMHKSMIKLLGKPLLEHTLEKLKNKNLTDIIIVVGKNNNIESYFGDGKKFGLSIQYVLQEKPEGAGRAVSLCKSRLKGDFLLLNSYHVDIDRFIDKLLAAKTRETDGVLLVKQKEDVWNYGVIEAGGQKVKSIVEKPKKSENLSNLCIVGVYLLSQSFIDTLEKTPLKHYQLEEALDNFVKEHNIYFVETNEETIVLKYPWDLLSVKNYLLANLKKHVGNTSIASTAQLMGEVFIEDGVKIMENAVIKGPCYIGKNAFVGTNSILRDGVDLEENSVAGANMEVKNTLISEGSKTHSGYIGDSLVGKDCRIGAGFNSANVRLDRETVKVIVKGKKTDTGLKSFGVVMGNNTRIGIKSSTMPGVIIGANVTVGSGTMVMNNIADGVRYYTKFQEVVTKNEK
ncbi:MAG: bifunctional sugar-1-phosphate nucleotidylyltransferase/acetyltransferase [Candidatus Levyibacteriota bacterium]|jgi:bifunctional UDP-N-acetylglucosamine pyrophosphorylase/glucosamine-1-phosphate N-acetyltransferase